MALVDGRFVDTQQRAGVVAHWISRSIRYRTPLGGIVQGLFAFAEVTSRTPQRLRIAAGVAIESQPHLIRLLGCAPAAFGCARAIVPSMQANASFGTPSATTWTMIRFQTPATAQRRKRRQA
jgi:hypothetical protein